MRLVREVPVYYNTAGFQKTEQVIVGKKQEFYCPHRKFFSK